MSNAKWNPAVINSKMPTDGFDGLIGVEELNVPVVTFHNDGLFQNTKSKKRKSNLKNTGPTKKKKKKLNTSNNTNTWETEKKLTFNEGNTSFLNEMKSWGIFGIHSEILYALYKKKFFEPTRIQSQCLGPAICGRMDILGAAETGSGKTLAFGIPIVNGILSLKSQNLKENNEEQVENSDLDEEDWEDRNLDIGCIKVKTLKTKIEKNKLYALILTPTRELAVQVKDHLTHICMYTDIKVALVVGGLAQEKQERILKKRPEIVVGTPGRLWELISEKNIHLQDIGNIKYLAIDETDRMLEKGHFAELLQLLERINLNEKQKKGRQNFIFSATLTVVHDPPSYLKGKKKKRITPGQKLQDLINKIGITNPKIIDITNSQVTAENLIEYKIYCKFEEKDYYLYNFLKMHSGRVIIFCNSIGCVKRLANLLTVLGLKPLPLHANMEQKQRLKNLEKFRDFEKGLLIATDVAARGLDIPNVNHVIHYQVPKTAETYVHRSGRTARVENSGNALLLIEPQEHKAYSKLMHTLGRSKDIEDFLVDLNELSHIKKIIHLARDIDQLSLAIKRENSKNSWYQKAIKDMDLIIDEEEIPRKLSSEAETKIKKDLNIKKKQLNELLKRPVLPRHTSGKFLDINFEKDAPMSQVRRDKLKIPGAFVLRKRCIYHLQKNIIQANDYCPYPP